jgi:hypothetical protein
MMIKPVDNFIFMPEVGYGKVLQGGISRQDNQNLRGNKTPASGSYKTPILVYEKRP